MMSPRERYCNDPAFNSLVKALASQIKNCHFTPTELREAVILAAIIVQEETPIPPLVGRWLRGEG
jgi:hypothetical protein